MSKVRGPCLPRNMKSDPFTPTTSPVSGGTSASKVVSKVWAFKMVRTCVGFWSFGSSGFRIEFRCKTNRPCSSRIASVTIVPASLGSLRSTASSPSAPNLRILGSSEGCMRYCRRGRPAGARDPSILRVSLGPQMQGLCLLLSSPLKLDESLE